LSYNGQPKASSYPIARSEGNYHHKKASKPKNMPIAVRKEAGCRQKDRWGNRCGKPLATDSYAYCEKCKVEIRRSV